jgi:hypothetical protein
VLILSRHIHIAIFLQTCAEDFFNLVRHSCALSQLQYKGWAEISVVGRFSISFSLVMQLLKKFIKKIIKITAAEVLYFQVTLMFEVKSAKLC